MREIKFRAWHNRFKEMKYNPSIWGSSRGGIDELNTMLSNMQDDDKFILMQYTGVKDDDEKDIYEGDIIEYTYNRDTMETATYTEVVEWEENSNGVGFGINVNQMKKIIGNIYENPELI